MMKLRAIFLVLLVVAMANIASATYITGEIRLYENGESRFNIESDIPLDIEGLTYNNEVITGRTDQLINLQRGVWTFSLNLEEYDNVLLDIKLPRDLDSITSIEGVDNIINFEDKIITLIDSGPLTFEVKYKLEDTSDYSYLIWIAIILIIFLGFFIYRKSRKKKDRLNTLRPLISDQEEKIIDSLLKGPKRQKEIRKELDIPKASFTRYIINLKMHLTKHYYKYLEQTQNVDHCLQD